MAGLAIGLLVVAVLMWALVSGFRDRQIKRNAAALTEPAIDVSKTGATRPGTPRR